MAIPGEFLRKGPVRAVCSITNLHNGEIYLYTSEDAVASFRKERFSLDLGMHRSKALQESYSSLGLELFLLSIDMEADEGESLEELLEKRKEYWKKEGKVLLS